MTVRKYIEVCCNECGAQIGNYGNCSKKMARRFAKEDGAVLVNDKEFCNDECVEKNRAAEEKAAENKI